MLEAPPLLQVQQLSRRHPDGQRWLLRDISLAIRAGERLALVGPSGAGKTLLLRAMVLLDPMEQGRLHWRGQPLVPEAIPRFRSQAVYLPQRPTVSQESVEAALEQPYALEANRQRRFDRDLVLRLLADFGRDASFLAQRPRDLSGGERQLTALVRAIQLEPTLLLLDEPTAALDVNAVAAAERLLDRWARAVPDRAMVWVTHDPALARRVSQRIVSIEAGELGEETSP